MTNRVNDHDTFFPIIFNEADQGTQIDHLKQWIKRVSEQQYENDFCAFFSNLLSQGIAKFIELDLLRYGVLPGSSTGEAGFCVVRRSAAVRSFIDAEIVPKDVTAAAALLLVANGTVLVNTGYDNGHPCFIFSAADETTVIRELAALEASEADDGPGECSEGPATKSADKPAKLN